MIASLRGRLIEKHPNQAIVEAGGVGYDVTIPVSTFSSLGETGSEVRLRVYTHVREDALQLFGFLTGDEKAVFERLISVSGIGPKLAITVLSGLATPDLVAAIREGAVERLVRIPGVGKKTAERMVLELRDKLDMVPGTARAAAAADSSSRRTGRQRTGRALRAAQSGMPARRSRAGRAQGEGRRRRPRIRAAVPQGARNGALSVARRLLTYPPGIGMIPILVLCLNKRCLPARSLC